MGQNMYFFTDRCFSCGRSDVFNGARIFSITGCDAAEKHCMIRLISEIFREYPQNIYFSPFEKHLPDAVHFPQLGAIVICSPDSIMAESISARTYDMNQLIHIEPSAAGIIGYTMEQSSRYRSRALELLGITDMLLHQYSDIGKEFVAHDRLKYFAVRKAGSLLPDLEKPGSSIKRPVSALTCSGYRFAGIPDDFRLISLRCQFPSASDVFITAFAREAMRRGHDIIISHAADSLHSPMHMTIPGQKLMIVSEPEYLCAKPAVPGSISLDRFYPLSVRSALRREVRTYGKYIRSLAEEMILCSRMCADIRDQGRKLISPYIPAHAAEDTAADIVSCILNLQSSHQ